MAAVKNMEIALLFDFYGDVLTEKQREIISLYYENDLSLSEIAENKHITRQGVRDAVKRAENQLLEMEERLGLARRFREVQAAVDAISQAAQEIRSLNARQAGSREIHDLAAKITGLAQEILEH